MRGLGKQDFIVSNHGSVWTIRAVSKRARRFAKRSIRVESWMGSPENFSTDHRPARELCERLDADGFSVCLA